MKKLILLPNLLHEESAWRYKLPPIDALIAESEKGGYTFLKKMGHPPVPTHLLNEHTQNIDELLNLSEGVVGLISDAGLPCIADPGSNFVAVAKKKGISVEAIPGPNSILMALQLSGLPAQKFAFHGYFPREEGEFKKVVRSLQKTFSHVFIETPYRFGKIFEWLIATLPPSVQLCVAIELMGPNEKIETKTIQNWKQSRPKMGKHRAVYIIYEE